MLDLSPLGTLISYASSLTKSFNFVSFSITNFLTLNLSRLANGSGTLLFVQASSVKILIGSKSLIFFELKTTLFFS